MMLLNLRTLERITVNDFGHSVHKETLETLETLAEEFSMLGEEFWMIKNYTASNGCEEIVCILDRLIGDLYDS